MKYLFILFLLLAACKNVKRGEVVDKYYYPAHYMTTYVVAGKVMIPIENYIPDTYCVKIRGIKEKDTIISEINMYHNEWITANIGDTLDFNKP